MLESVLAVVALSCPIQGEVINPNAIYNCTTKAQPKQKELLPCVDSLELDKFYICTTKVTTKPYKWVRSNTIWIKGEK